MHRSFSVTTLLTLCLIGLLAVTGAAQSNTGTLTGIVVGPDGAVIPGASIEVKDNQTGKIRTVLSRGEGTFTLPQLEVGTYTITVTVQGFKKYTATDLKINIGQEYSLNVNMEVGDTVDSVTVTAGAEVVNATNAELSNTVSARQIQELPLNGRNPLALISLQAGVSNNGNTTINGQQSSFTNITRDGINVQDNFIRSNAVDFTPDRSNVDDVGEFTIVTQNAGAELGYGASQVQLVTPRGANTFHGAAFLFNRNSQFAANSFFNNRDNIDRPFLNRNQFGGRISGPILRDKLFFFFFYEGFRLRQSEANPRNATILLPDARQGIFTYRDNSGQTRTLNVLQAAGVTADPIVQNRILANLPTTGNNTRVGDGLNTTGYSYLHTQNQDREALTWRFDYELNDRHSLNTILSYKKENNQRPDIDGTAGFSRTPFGSQGADTPFVALAWRGIFTNSFTNEVRGGWQGSDPVFANSFTEPQYFIGVPLITSPEVTFRPQGRDTDIFNIQDNAVWTKGSHSFRFGGQAQAFRVQSFTSFNTIPTLTLGTNINTPALATNQFPGGISNAQLSTANSLLALLGGIVGAANVSAEVIDPNAKTFTIGAFDVNRLNYENISFYLSDQWRARQGLTFSLGLRYELFTPLRNPDRLYLEPVISNLNDPRASLVDPNGSYDFIGTNSGGDRFHKLDKDNFAPVVSAAWAPGSGKMVFRGGYRMSYVNDEFIRGADNALGGNAGISQTINLVENGSTSLNRRLNDGLPTFTPPAFQVPITYAQGNINAGNFFNTVFAVDPYLQVPRIHEWNFGIQRELWWDTVFEVRYVGGMSNNLARAFDFNQVQIRESGMLDDFKRARANLLLATAARQTDPTVPLTGAYNPNLPGSQQLTVFPNMVAGGLLNNGTIRNFLLNGQVGELALIYITNGLEGTVPLRANNQAGVVDLLTNSGKYRYNSLQAEIRRRFRNGLYFQANYTFQKTLSDAEAADTAQSNFAPFLDILNPQIEYARTSFDQTHIFNANFIYELPFGQGRRWLSSGGVSDRIFGGWQMTSIFRVGSGQPFSINDPLGTLNRAGRSGPQTAQTNLSKSQIRDLTGVFKTPCGIYYINPSVININSTTCAGTGRATEGFGSTPFSGQVFFNNGPGETGGLERRFLNGPWFFNWDASLIKNIRIREEMKFQLRLEAFNLLNNTNFFFSNGNINSTSFGQITSAASPRIVQIAGRFEF